MESFSQESNPLKRWNTRAEDDVYDGYDSEVGEAEEWEEGGEDGETDDAMELDDTEERPIREATKPFSRPFVRQGAGKLRNNERRPDDLLMTEQPKAKEASRGKVWPEEQTRPLQEFEVDEVFVRYLPMCTDRRGFLQCLTQSSHARMLTTRSKHHKKEVVLCPELMELTGIVSLNCTYPLMTWIREMTEFVYLLQGGGEEGDGVFQLLQGEVGNFNALALYIKWLVGQSAYNRLLYHHYGFSHCAMTYPPGQSVAIFWHPHSDHFRRYLLSKAGIYIDAIDKRIPDAGNVDTRELHAIRLCYEAALGCLVECPTKHWMPPAVRNVVDCMTLEQTEEDAKIIELGIDWTMLLGDWEITRVVDREERF